MLDDFPVRFVAITNKDGTNATKLPFIVVEI